MLSGHLHGDALPSTGASSIGCGLVDLHFLFIGKGEKIETRLIGLIENFDVDAGIDDSKKTHFVKRRMKFAQEFLFRVWIFIFFHIQDRDRRIKNGFFSISK